MLCRLLQTPPSMAVPISDLVLLPSEATRCALSPHHDSQLLLASLPESTIKRNVEIATSMPASVNPFLECEHDQVITVQEARQWFRLLGYSA